MASKTVEDVLFPGTDVRVERVSDSSGGLVVEAISTGRPGRCPEDCRKQARRVHSSYQRTCMSGRWDPAGSWCGYGYAGTSATAGAVPVGRSSSRSAG